MQPIVELSQEEKDKQRIEAKQKREALHKQKHEERVKALVALKAKQKEKWWRDWEYSGRLLILFQPSQCKAGIHIWRPKMVLGKWDGKTLACVAANCKAERVCEEGSDLQKEMKEAVKVYDMWNEKGIAE